MPLPSLIVPMRCEAMVANTAVVKRTAFRQWPFNYLALPDFRSPEPEPLSGLAKTKDVGVFVHWTLPAALREGRQDAATGAIVHPLVPNRWLVVRVRGSDRRTVTGWVVESDCPKISRKTPGDSADSSLYLVDPPVVEMWRRSGDPIRGAFVPAADGQPSTPRIGVRFELDGWSERAADSVFLTAVAPANPLFSGYFPHHRNVFGIYDQLTGIDSDQLSYYVVGWYSDPARDILATATGDTQAELLAALRWALDNGDEGGDGAAGGPAVTRSFYTGGCFGIDWQRNGPAPEPDALHDITRNPTLNIAIANTPVDAFTAMVGVLLKEPGTTALLRAFNHDLLDVLNQVNGGALLEQRIRQEWFGSVRGGDRWVITPEDSETPAELTDAETVWLNALNLNQAELDGALDHVFALQWQVNAIWYKRGVLAGIRPVDRPPAAELDAALDPARPDSPAARLVAALERVRTLLARVPRPLATAGASREQAYQAGIADFAAKRGLGAGKRLKADVPPRHWRPNNPTIVLSGVKSPYAADPTKALTVRLSGRIVSGLVVGEGAPLSRATAAAALPALPNLAALPEPVGALVDELFLLDPANAASLAAAAGVGSGVVAAIQAAGDSAALVGLRPELTIARWSQDWEPLFLEWRGDFLPIPHGAEDDGNWHFDGTDYRFAGSGVASVAQQVGGISLLSPQTQLVLGARLKTFLDKFGAGQEGLGAIYERIGEVFGWKFLTQELVGFNEGLLRRDTRAFRRPWPGETIGGGGGTRHRLSDLLGYDDPGAGAEALPDALRGRVDSVPMTQSGAFHGIRAGQFYFNDVILYDRFGRVLEFISRGTQQGLNSHDIFPVLIDEAFRPNVKLAASAGVKSVIELPPRLVQPGQVDVQLIDNSDDGVTLAADVDANPVCGWLVPNHLDGSILLYGPDGANLGDVRLLVDIDGDTRRAVWAPPPRGDVRSVEDLGRVSPHLRDFVKSPVFQQKESFNAFLRAIDSTLWTVDPLGGRTNANLTSLVGRALALVRVRLRLRHSGAPLSDPGWANTLRDEAPAWIRQKYALRLGDQATRQDGTIGYFAGTDYDVFNSVVPPDDGQAYVRQIGPLGSGRNYPRLSFEPDDSVTLTLLLDPRGSARVFTGLFPVKTLELPNRFVDGPLSRMALTFRMGPILTTLHAATSADDRPPPFEKAITLPLPAEQGGSWSWWEAVADAAEATGHDITAATPNAVLPPVPNSLREGMLQLLIDLTEKK
ncbi:hypothetical protein [Azospirillum agricola]|uniref:hypothetical protein n=1 Tax=Azospirillum agricola TaxID=1720247 RepID=UPI000A0F13FE|nr:hypothetical protein [Azospirillum agricola]SMH31966.1 hypothetical protein SAMN02982994_0538 [Azospirillum lipoferum]